jgi:hypothetical protein
LSAGEIPYEGKHDKIRWHSNEETEKCVMVAVDNVSDEYSDGRAYSSDPRTEEDCERAWDEDLRPKPHSEKCDRKQGP